MRDEQGNNLYSIGKLADIVGIPATALRFYDEQGVLKPQIRDDETGYRYYTEEQVMKCMFISEMRRLGLTVADIKALCEKSSLTFQREALINRMVLLNDELDHLLFKKAYLEELMRNVDMGLGYFESAKICRENHIPDVYKRQSQTTVREGIIFLPEWRMELQIRSPKGGNQMRMAEWI